MDLHHLQYSNTSSLEKLYIAGDVALILGYNAVISSLELLAVDSVDNFLDAFYNSKTRFLGMTFGFYEKKKVA